MQLLFSRKEANSKQSLPYILS